MTTLLLLAGCGLRGVETPPALPLLEPSTLSRRPAGPPDRIVDCNGGGDHTTIGAAIRAAADREFIEVWPCTYRERIDFAGKSLWIGSSGGPSVTTIDGSNNGAVVTAKGGEGDRTALVGFTLDDGNGQAVDVEMSALRLQDINIISTSGAYAIRARSADLEMVNVTIDSSNGAFTASVHADKGAVLIHGGSITCGTGDALFLGHGSFLVDGLVLRCPSDLALEVEHSVGRLQRSRLQGDLHILTEDDHFDDLIGIENTSVDGDIEVTFGTFAFRNSITTGALHFTDVADTVTVENSIFVGAPCSIETNVALGPIRYNNFVAGTSHCDGSTVVGSSGNFQADPLFVDPLAGDLHLQAGSPCIDAGSPDAAYRDVNGSRNDLGLYGGRYNQDGGY